MNRKLILVIIIIIAGSIAVVGEASTRKAQGYTAACCNSILNGRAISLPEPVYPESAQGKDLVRVKVLVDEEGNVINASAVDGPPLLRAAAVQAARGAKFPPTFWSGQPVKVSGSLVYIFREPPQARLAAPASGSSI